MQKVLVLGCGVIGLETARQLRKRLKVKVVLYSENEPSKTTSVGAGGLWEPYHCEPEDLVQKWGEESLEYFVDLMSREEGLVELVEHRAYKKEIEPPPYWSNALNGFVNYHTVNLLDGNEGNRLEDYTCMDIFKGPIVCSPKYLEYVKEMLEADEEVEILMNQPKLEDIPTLLELARKTGCCCIANCTGLGSKELFNDEKLKPARGALLVYDRLSTMKYSVSSSVPPLGTETEPIYILLRGDEAFCGGTFLLDDTNMQVTDAETKRIDSAAKLFYPQLGEIKRKWVGLRPYRVGGIRFEREDLASKDDQPIPVFHNYGHGGGGWTLAFGAAKATCEKIQIYILSLR